jgi:hypothetical protein
MNSESAECGITYTQTIISYIPDASYFRICICVYHIEQAMIQSKNRWQG